LSLKSPSGLNDDDDNKEITSFDDLQGNFAKN